MLSLNSTLLFGYNNSLEDTNSLFELFKSPLPKYHPFVRWWWNGNKIEKKELIRELKILKAAGIGGVEINPVKFPSRYEGDDLGQASVDWLSKDWINCLSTVFEEAKKLELTCDLIIGTGWPFGSEKLPRKDRAKSVAVEAIPITGPTKYEISKYHLYRSVDPQITTLLSSRTFKILSLVLVPETVSSLDEIKPLSISDTDILSIDVPKGNYFLYATVEIESYAEVINGAPGGSGPILDHYNSDAVKRYLDDMAERIELFSGPISNNIRSLFIDSMELERSNWSSNFVKEFKKRNGYDLMPYLPLILFKPGRYGVYNHKYGAERTKEFNEILSQVRFDFEFTKAQLLDENFTQVCYQWCIEKNVMLRRQGYGSGFLPIQTNFGCHIPEGESWTTNYLKHRVGYEMPDDDYRRGRAYTMVNKYVSSAAHLDGKRLISCEEMTNTYRVFNTTLEDLKVGSDQSIFSGITHSVWHGYNYSPPEAPYPGWIRYGSYYNENNNWWPYFELLNTYKARISALLQNADMFTNIAILTANYDLFAEMGSKRDPFPEKLNVPYTSLVWEAIQKNGGAADYISDDVLKDVSVKKEHLVYGLKKYKVLIVLSVERISLKAMENILLFLEKGGQVLFVDKYPSKSSGKKNYRFITNKIKSISSLIKDSDYKSTLSTIPEDNKFLEWYAHVQEQNKLPFYLKIKNPNRFFLQTRYIGKDNSQILFLSNSNIDNSFETKLFFSNELTKNRRGWIWNAETGAREPILLGKESSYHLNLGPSESRIIIFDNNKYTSNQKISEKEKIVTSTELENDWELIFKHSQEIPFKRLNLSKLEDLSKNERYANFSGNIIYKTTLYINNNIPLYISIGKLSGLGKIIVNGHVVGINWYSQRKFRIRKFLKPGNNFIEIHVITLMGNYMKYLTDNPTAQYWTNKGSKNQPKTKLGLFGPVKLYFID